MSDSAVALMRARRCGSVVVTVTRNPGMSVEQLLLLHGLQPRAAALSSITPRIACEHIAALLWKDLAYGIEIMPFAQAQALTRAFVHAHACNDARCYSNGEWRRAARGNDFLFDPLTEATFSATVLLVQSDYAVSITVEDED